ncbi:hypothetical protein HGD16_001563 [Campylobacter coli]|nr:hypothetical protein [Campylobacter coli]
MHDGITHQIKTDKDFGILLNVVCNIREKLDESFNEEDKSLVIDIDELIEKTCEELEKFSNSFFFLAHRIFFTQA